MTYFDVYIGDLEDPRFSWDKGDGYIPKGIGPTFPPTRTKRGYPGNVFAEVVGRIDDGGFEGKKIEWGAWAAKVDKATLLSFVDDLYFDDESYSGDSRVPHLVEWLEELRAVIESLDEDKKYALVASET